MITIIADKSNTLNQISYDKFLDNINYHQLLCSCGMSGCFNKHGYYSRSIKTSEGILTLSILRVRCKHCGKTHAIFPHVIVPYSQILLYEHILILTAYINKTSFDPIMINIISIDESNIRYIICKYLSHWKEVITAFGFSIADDILALVEQCLNTFKRQFMQIKSIPNILFNNNHIT